MMEELEYFLGLAGVTAAYLFFAYGVISMANERITAIKGARLKGYYMGCKDAADDAYNVTSNQDLQNEMYKACHYRMENMK